MDVTRLREQLARVTGPARIPVLLQIGQTLGMRYLSPGGAVNAVHRRSIDPGRELPPFRPGAHRRTVGTTDLTRPALSAALACYGC